MATERQILANRANAAKSTGPRTARGKKISSQNATVHGLVSTTVVLKGESMRRFNDLAAALILQFQPRNSAESFLVRKHPVNTRSGGTGFRIFFFSTGGGRKCGRSSAAERFRIC
jgi:hypothetical protein